MKSAEIRSKFLDYFKGKNHVLLPSAPLIPEGDPSLLFNSAGMVPFKPYFLGLRKDLSRAASCQKCFRTADIGRVGETVRHLTFFEMLGNFSFGDYFKEETILWAWEFLTKEMKLDPGRLHFTVYKEDEEALGIWKKVLPSKLSGRIVRLDEDTNFWAMGPTGPCGPCSEIYWDLGEKAGCGKPSCAPGCDCDRYLEIWNLVFTQFDRQEDGELKALPRKNIDTGMGLERLAMVLQGKSSPFETDLFWAIEEQAASILKKLPGQNKQAFRIISDHLRGSVFLASEGTIVPSNEGRGYVLRRLIRRALRYGRLLGHEGPFLHRLVPSAIEIFKSVYPELKSAGGVETTIKNEEEGFLKTLETGEELLQGILQKHPKVLPGEEVFKLYDTYGFPLELTREISASKGTAVDEKGFEKARKAAQETARKGWKDSGEKDTGIYHALKDKGFSCRFTGYETMEVRGAKILAIVKDGKEVQDLKMGESGEVVLEETPFYPEGGGQVGDIGTLIKVSSPVNSAEIARAVVSDTRQPLPGLIVHSLKVEHGYLQKGDVVKAWVSQKDRIRTMCHHTATHLLNEALRRVLGPQVRQAGSLVEPQRLRFDFSFQRALTPEEIQEVEKEVNRAIDKDYKVSPQEKPMKEAGELGAVTLLGEKYSQNPRCVLINERGWESPKERFSLELCGGTHVSHAGMIKFFKILKETSISAGMRRIEAVAGPALLDDYSFLRGTITNILREMELQKIVQALLERRKKEKTLPVSVQPMQEVVEKLQKSDESLQALKTEMGALRQKLLSGGQMGEKMEKETSSGIRILAERFEGLEIGALRSLSDKRKKESKKTVIFLSSVQNGRLSFVLSWTEDLADKKLNASSLAKKLAQDLEGSAGGRADFAQGGGKDPGDISSLISLLEKALQ